MTEIKFRTWRSLLSDFEQVNSPTGRDTLPKCPRIQLIRVCAKLADHKIDNGRFCGYRIDRTSLTSVEYTPTMACMYLNTLLRDQLNTAKTIIPAPDKETPSELLNSDVSFEEKISVARRYMEQEAPYLRREAVIKRWRTEMFREHVTPVEKPEDLTEEQVLSFVERVVKDLEEVTGFDPVTNRYPLRPSFCSRAPRNR